MKACAGLCTVIDSKAVQLLSRKSAGRLEVWRAREIFVETEREMDVTIRRGEDLQELHSKRS